MNNIMDIESIELRRYIPELRGKKIEIITPPMNAPFGLEEVYGKYQLKLCFNNYKTDHEMRSFIQKIQNVEHRLSTLAPTTNYHSNIKINKKFDPLLVLRINKDEVELLQRVAKLKGGEMVRANILLDRLWSYNDKSGTTFLLTDLEVISHK